ncbi:MAG TPA: DUF6701 domain-containing protein [Gallionella sp.]|nr:DUF6701 domain-containing protein [Gallionella sp.]
MATTESYTIPNTYSWKAPAGVTSVTVEAWGGGGAGGGATGRPAEGGGGAGGQYAIKVITVTPGNSYTVVVGAGGAGSTGNGTDGGDSSFSTSVVAKGGAGGAAATNNNTGGTAGVGSATGGVGSTVFAGGSGSDGGTSRGRNCTSGGAGGGGAGSSGVGGNASGNNAGTGTANGGGDGGAGISNSGSGNAGSNAGGGGGSACAENTTDESGGNGAAGMVNISYLLPGGMGSGVINTYYPGTASVAAGATSISLGAATGAGTPISAGDMLIIMQMQDATIDSTNTATYGKVSAANAGKYEYAIATSNVPLGGGTLTLSCATINAYTNAGYVAGSSGQHTFQVIRVPVFANATLNSTLTALAWNGSRGGVLAFDVTGVLNLNSAAVSVDGLGFRGGAARNETSGSGANTDYRTPVSNLANGSKGEGIAGTPYYVLTSANTLTTTGIEGYPNGSFARGAPANGAGGATDIDPANNDYNPGGGGGGNGGSGGQGGIGWCPGFTTTAPYYGCGISSLATSTNLGGSTGGIGGSPVAGLGATRLTMGGGGGAGTTNNATGANGALSTSGVPGGGIIMVRAGSISGTGTLTANGYSGDQTVANDGGGGAGAGGVIMVSAASGLGGLTAQANGGMGGSTLVPGLRVPNTTATPHGPGGGGGGGLIITSGATAAASAAGGSNGVSYNGGATTPFTNTTGSYGSTPGSIGIVNSGLTASSIPGVALGGTGCSGPDHLALQSSGSGLTCAASTLTVIACANAACSTLYTAGVTGTLSPTSGTPTVNWDATTGGAAGSGFVISSGSSSVTKSMQVATAGNVGLGVSTATPLPPNPTTCNFGTNPANNNCVFTANTAGFIFSNSATGSSYTIPPLYSGLINTAAGQPNATPLYLRAVQASTTNPAVCTPAIINSAASVNMSYTCNNPVFCQAVNLATINATTIARVGTTPVQVSMAFDANGSSLFTMHYDDVGQITLNASATVTPFSGATPVALSGSSNAFVVVPHHFGISGIPAGPFKAGNNFAPAASPYTTVTAYNGLATPTATKNFGLETAPESVTLSFTKCQPTGTNSSNGTFSGSVGTFASGVANATNLNWSEVGNGDLVATLTSGSYLGSGLTATGNTSMNVGGATCYNGGAGYVGRFMPDHFDTVVTPGMTCPTGLTCPTVIVANDQGFVYSGQGFTTNVYARNAAGGPTVNYDGTTNTSPNFAKQVTLTAWSAPGSTSPPAASASLLGSTIGAASFKQGTTYLGTPATPIYTFGTTPTTPTNIYIRAADGDATSLRVPAGSSVEGGIMVVSGRVYIANAYGSELLPLPLTAAVQYWNSTTGWVTSATDNVTQFNTNLSSSSGNVVASIVSGLSGISVVSPGVVTVSAGTAPFTLSPPGVAGSADISLNAPGYLLGGSNGAAINPSYPGRATFGVYKGSDEFIYRRENY